MNLGEVESQLWDIGRIYSLYKKTYLVPRNTTAETQWHLLSMCRDIPLYVGIVELTKRSGQLWNRNTGYYLQAGKQGLRLGPLGAGTVRPFLVMA